MSTALGRAAEDAAASFLQQRGLRILARNWRTRWCEIDIVAGFKKRVYFFEVKYRTNNSWGSGLEYVTPQKVGQMRFAAEMWIANQPAAHEYRLGAIELTGTPPRITALVDDI